MDLNSDEIIFNGKRKRRRHRINPYMNGTHGHTAYQCHRSFAIGLYLFPALLPFFVILWVLYKIYKHVS